MRDLVLVRGPVLVVQLALLVVGQHLVRFVELLELRLVAARVGVVLARELAERLLYLVSRGVARNAERFIVVGSRCHAPPPFVLPRIKQKRALNPPASACCYFLSLSPSSGAFSRFGPPLVTVTMAGRKTFDPIL